jgi:hypothetical protein
MTDYSVWIYAMLAVGALITAAVVYALSAKRSAVLE